MSTGWFHIRHLHALLRPPSRDPARDLGYAGSVQAQPQQLEDEGGGAEGQIGGRRRGQEATGRERGEGIKKL